MPVTVLLSAAVLLMSLRHTYGQPGGPGKLTSLPGGLMASNSRV